MSFTKESPDRANLILTVINLDTEYTQSGFVSLPLWELGIPESSPFEVEDLLTGARYTWNGPSNYVELNPSHLPAHILHIPRNLQIAPDTTPLI